MELKALVKSTNSNVICRFFARTPSRILWMVNICEVVDLFLWKTFWFFLRMLSILGSMQFRSRALNKVSRRKCTTKAKLKAANQQERIKLWKQHFKNLLGNPPKVMHEPITRIISKQLDIKVGPFTQEELDSVLRKIKNWKAAGLDEITPEVWKTRQFDNILLRLCNAVYNKKKICTYTIC